jgi:hypothetical protein
MKDGTFFHNKLVNIIFLNKNIHFFKKTLIN